RPRAARQPALRAVPLRDLPGVDRHARRARAGGPERENRARRARRLDRGVISTYSIAACDLERGQWGVATQSKFLAVGSIVPWAEPEAGAVATQASGNPRYGPAGLALLRDGATANEVVGRLTATDPGREQRQVGVVDAAGRSATYTGAECLPWAGGVTGACFAAQGNLLVSAETVEALAEAFESSARAPLAERLLRCLGAAQAAVCGAARRRAQRRLCRPLRRRRRPARRRPPDPDRGARTAVPAASAAVRLDAARGVARGRARARGRDPRAADGPRLRGRPCDRARDVGGDREPRGARRRRRAGRPGRARAAPPPLTRPDLGDRARTDADSDRASTGAEDRRLSDRREAGRRRRVAGRPAPGRRPAARRRARRRSRRRP